MVYKLDVLESLFMRQRMVRLEARSTRGRVAVKKIHWYRRTNGAEKFAPVIN